MSSIVLAGGRGTRLGQDKVNLVIAGKSLLQRTVDRLTELSEEIIVVLAQGQTPPHLDASGNVRMTTDLHPRKGPLVGIHAGLTASRDQYSLAVACDMPFLNLSLIRHMMALAPGHDIVIPRLDELVEPLHAIYSRNCLPRIEGTIGQGNFRVYELLNVAKVRYVDQDEIEEFDPEHMSFFNINTPADLEKARELIAREGVRP